MSTPNYFAHDRPEMLAYIPQQATAVLDVGCSSGRFGTLLKERGPIEVWGIEPHKPAAEQATQHLDRVFTGSVEEHINQLPDAFFDVITFNDVLEHLATPEDILKTIRPKLKPGGIVVASLPNMRYWRALYHLVFEKDWKYTDAGILDRTHLRFFTQKSMSRLFTNAGFRVLLQEGINQYGTHRRFPFHIVTLGWGLGWLRDASFLQFACVARAA